MEISQVKKRFCDSELILVNCLGWHAIGKSELVLLFECVDKYVFITCWADIGCLIPESHDDAAANGTCRAVKSESVTMAKSNCMKE